MTRKYGITPHRDNQNDLRQEAAKDAEREKHKKEIDQMGNSMTNINNEHDFFNDQAKDKLVLAKNQRKRKAPPMEEIKVEHKRMKVSVTQNTKFQKSAFFAGTDQ